MATIQISIRSEKIVYKDFEVDTFDQAQTLLESLGFNTTENCFDEEILSEQLKCLDTFEEYDSDVGFLFSEKGGHIFHRPNEALRFLKSKQEDNETLKLPFE